MSDGGWVLVGVLIASAVLSQLGAIFADIRGRSPVPWLAFGALMLTGWTVLIALHRPSLPIWALTVADWVLYVKAWWDEWRKRRRPRRRFAWRGYKAEALRARLLDRARAAGA